jgi:hypothetical protein
MDINNIALSGFIIEEWYGDSTLVPGPAAPVAISIPKKTPPIPSPPAPVKSPEPMAGSSTYKFLGNNLRRLTIIIDCPGTAFLPDEELGFLTKILEACRMNIGDVAIVNHHAAPVAITLLRQQLQPANIILFGIEPTAIRLPINFPFFKLQPYDQCTYLYAPPLQQMVGITADAKLLKSKLWVCLKTLFDV